MKDDLFIAPVANIRCFVQCPPECCICNAIIDNKFCLVTADAKKQALETILEELSYLDKIVQEIENET